MWSLSWQKCHADQMSSAQNVQSMQWEIDELMKCQADNVTRSQVGKMTSLHNGQMTKQQNWRNAKLTKVHYTKWYIDEMAKYQLTYQLLLRRAPLFQKWVEELSAEWWVHDSSKRQLVRLVVVRSVASRAFVALTLKLAQTPLAEAFCLALFKHRIQWLKQIIPLHLTT